jgi:predicted nucleic acid-binding protein
MPDYVLDSGILVRHLRRRPGYLDLMNRLSEEGELYISAFTRVEILRGMRDHERERTFLLLNALITHPVDRETADRAGELLRIWQAKGLALSGPDAIIAATALQLQASLLTTNPRHFPMPDLIVLSVDEEGRVTRLAR